MRAAWPQSAGWTVNFGSTPESDVILAAGLQAAEAALEEEDEMADAMLVLDTQEDLASNQNADFTEEEVDYEEEGEPEPAVQSEEVVD